MGTWNWSANSIVPCQTAGLPRSILGAKADQFGYSRVRVNSHKNVYYASIVALYFIVYC